MITTDSFIDIGHTAVSHRTIGRGPDLVFVHGWPLHGDTWRNIAAPLSSSFTCHVIDLPGAGLSRATESTPLNFIGHAASVSAVIEQLGLERFALIGHDSGGLIARLVAAERPQQVTALVLSGTEIPGHHPWQVALYGLLGNLPDAEQILPMILADSVLMGSPLALGGSFTDVERIPDGFFDILSSFLGDDEVRKSQIEFVGNIDSSVIDGLEATHSQLTMPTLFIWGEDDPFFPVEKARAMAEQFAGPTQFESIPGAKLFVHEDHAEQFTTLAHDFLVDLHAGVR